MPKSIEERVVGLQFENKEFEAGVQTSLKSLDNLNKGLSNAGKGDSLSSLASSIETISGRFSTLGIVGVTAIENITNTAVNAAANLAKSLTIDPIGQGYQDYERKLTSVQTIMNATGASEKTVGGYFGQLDTYADKTIYNLDDMTSAFAKFTNAGVDMNKSVPAIKGVANMVALAGQDSNAASIAMYNLSQSIAGGFLTTTDFRSLNLANVATKEWKANLIEAAKSAGNLKRTNDGLYHIPGVKQAYTAQSLFTDGLAKQWATTNTLLKVLGDYGDTNTEIGKRAQAAAQDVKSFGMMMDTLKAAVGTSWTDSFTLIIGDLGESKKLFTELTNTIGGFLDKSGNARNEMLKFWKDNGGRDAIIKGIANAFKDLVSILKPIQEAFRSIFPPKIGETLVAFSKGFQELTANFKIGDDTSNKLYRTFSGLFAIVDMGAKLFGGLVKIVTIIAPAFSPLIDIFLTITAKIGDLLVSLDKSSKVGDIFKTIQDTVGKAANAIHASLSKVDEAFNGLVDLISAQAVKIKNSISQSSFDPFTAIGEALSEGYAFLEGIIKKIIPSFNKASDDLAGSMDKFKNSLGGKNDKADEAKPLINIGKGLADGFKVIKDVFSKVINTLKPLIGGVAKSFGDFGKAMGNAFQQGDFNKVLSLIQGSLFAAILLSIRNFITSLTSITKNVGKIGKSFSGMLDGVKDTLKAYQTELKADALIKIATAIAILSGSLAILSLINKDKLLGAVGAITVLFVELTGSMVIMEKNMSTMNVAKISATLLALSTSILIMSLALSKLSSIDPTSAVTGITAMSAILLSLALFIKATNTEEVTKVTGGLIGLAVAINIFTIAVSVLGHMDIGSLAKGLGSLGILLGELFLVMKFIDIKKVESSALAILSLGAAVKILAGAVKVFGGMDIGQLTQGLVGLGVMLAEIVGFTKLLKSDELVKSAGSLVIMATAMLLFTGAIALMGSMNIGEIAKGLGTLAGSLGIIVTALNFMPDDIQKKTTGLLALSASMVVLSLALKNMGGMALGEVATSLIVLAGALTIIVIAMNSMRGTAAGAAALLIVAGSLIILSAALKLLGSLSLSEIGKSLLSLVAIFVIVGGATKILGPLTPVMIDLAGAIALLGVSVLAVGLGMKLFADGLNALAQLASSQSGSFVAPIAKQLGDGVVTFADTIKNGMSSIVGAVESLFGGMIDAASKLIPQFVMVIVNGIVNLASQIASKAATLVQSGMAIVLSLLKGIEQHAPEVISTGIKLMTDLLKGIADHVKDIATIAGTIIIQFIEGVVTNTPKLIEAAMNLMIAFLNGVTKGIPGIITAAVDIVVSFLDTLGKQLPRIVDAGFKMVINFLNGVAKAIRDNTQPLIDAASNLGSAIIEGILKAFTAGAKPLLNMAKNVAEVVIMTIKNIFAKATDIADNIIQGIINGLVNGLQSVVKAAINLAKNALDGIKHFLGIHSPSTVFKDEVGKNVALGTAEGITANADAASKAAKNMASGAVAEAQKVITGTTDATTKAVSQQSQAYIDLSTTYTNTAQANVATHTKATAAHKKLADDEYKNAKLRIEDYRSASDYSASKELQMWKDLGTQYQGLSVHKVEIDKNEANLRKKIASETYADATTQIQKYRSASDYSAAKELQMWQDISTQYKLTAQQKTQVAKNEATLRTKITADEYADAKNQIMEYRKASDYSATEEVKVWEYLKTQYKVGSKERIDIDKQEAALHKQMVADKAAAEKAAFDASSNWISTKKELNQLSLTDEVTAWERVQARYLQGTEERKKADKSLYDAKQQLIAAQEDLLQKMQDAEDKYTQAVDDRSKAIYSSYGLFDELQKKEDVSGQTLIDNLGNQVVAMHAWAENLKSLATKGIDDGLLKELQGMGPSADTQIAALNSMTEDQLNTYQNLWKEKTSTAREEAVTELQGLRTDTDTAIAGMSADLAKLLVIPDAVTTKLADPTKFIAAGKSVADGLTKGYTDNSAQVVTAANTSADNVINAIKSKNSSFTAAGANSSKAVATGVTSQQLEIVTAAANAGAAGANALTKTSSSFQSAGSNAMAGFIVGMNSKQPEVNAAAAGIAAAAQTAVENKLKIKSPSKEFIKIGEYTGQGLVIGLKSMASSVASTASDMGSAAITSLSDVVSSVSDMMSMSLDSEPVIKPIIDLSDIHSGVSKMNDMLSTQKTVNLNLDKVNAVSASIGKTAKTTMDTSVNTETQPTQIINNFDMTGLTVRSDADVDAISAKLYQKQQQALRGKGVVSSPIFG